MCADCLVPPPEPNFPQVNSWLENEKEREPDEDEREVRGEAINSMRQPASALLTFDEMSIMNSMSNLFDIEIGNRSRDGCGATLG